MSSMTFIEVGGRPVWHEVAGSGEPVVLLHGGLSGASSFDQHTPAFVDAGYRVWIPERRGHGRTPDVDEPLTYAAMASDTIVYLDQVVGDPAPLIGWSDGAVVALLVAMRRPDLVTRMVLIGQYYNSAGRTEDPLADLVIDNPDTHEYLRHEYVAQSPGGDFDTFFGKTQAMWGAEPEIALAAIAGVRTRTLVLQGDRDDVLLTHSAAVVDALPDARLAVLPGTHMLPLESPDLVIRLILSFLTGRPAQRADLHP
ncbi:MAG: alpha/beta fold hydrolase [Jatrophihabitans sp.]